MSKQSVRIAIVGCGKITEDSHLPAALTSPSIHLEALVDTQVERAQRLASSFGLDVRAVAGLGDVLGSVDGIVVATSNHTHVEVAREALEAGKSVLVEKPLTTTTADAEMLCGLAEARGAQIAVGFVTRYFPSVILLESLLARGYLGRVASFRYEAGSRGGWAPLSAYNLDRAKAGGGVLVVTGAHFMDRMLHLFGEPGSFVYRDDSYGGVEANCHARMQFAGPDGPFSGEFLMSKSQTLGNRLEIRGSEYVCEYLESDSESVTLFPNKDPDLRLRVSGREEAAPQDHFRLQLEDFARAILDGRPPRVDGRQGTASVRLTEQMYAMREQLEEPWLAYEIASEVAG